MDTKELSPGSVYFERVGVAFRSSWMPRFETTHSLCSRPTLYAKGNSAFASTTEKETRKRAKVNANTIESCLVGCVPHEKIRDHVVCTYLSSTSEGRCPTQDTAKTYSFRRGHEARRARPVTFNFSILYVDALRGVNSRFADGPIDFS